jgi:hypothetical protein
MRKSLRPIFLKVLILQCHSGGRTRCSSRRRTVWLKEARDMPRLLAALMKLVCSATATKELSSANCVPRMILLQRAIGSSSPSTFQSPLPDEARNRRRAPSRGRSLRRSVRPYSHSALRSGGTSGMARPSPRREGLIRNLGDSASALVA